MNVKVARDGVEIGECRRQEPDRTDTGLRSRATAELIARLNKLPNMTTTTFLVSLSIGLLSFKWNPPAKPEPTFLNLAGGVWIAALRLFLAFTRYTYGEMERARLRRQALPEGANVEPDKSLHPR